MALALKLLNFDPNLTPNTCMHISYSRDNCPTPRIRMCKAGDYLVVKKRLMLFFAHVDILLFNVVFFFHAKRGEN